MKRIFAMILILLLLGSMMFGAVEDTTELGIHLTVAPVHEVKILEEVPLSVGAFNSAESIVRHDFTELAQSVDTYYMVVKTNNKSAVHIDVLVENMKSTGVVTQVKYTIASDTVEFTSSDAGVSGTLFTESLPLSQHGMRIVSRAFSITLDSSDVSMASSATYVANIVFSLVSP